MEAPTWTHGGLSASEQHSKEALNFVPKEPRAFAAARLDPPVVPATGHIAIAVIEAHVALPVFLEKGREILSAPRSSSSSSSSAAAAEVCAAATALHCLVCYKVEDRGDGSGGHRETMVSSRGALLCQEPSEDAIQTLAIPYCEAR